MAHPGVPQHRMMPGVHHAQLHTHNHNNAVKQGDVYETKNFDTIDYIVQIPVIDNPKKRQSRYLLAMGYRLQPRHGLGLMDTALEHLVHYYDMQNIQLIFCEQWNSVCIFIEFHNVEACRRAYDQLHQFFKSRFYVEDMAGLRKLWICDECHSHNAADREQKRDEDDDDDAIFCCRQCHHVTMRRLKKIKYLYQRASASASSSSSSSMLHHPHPQQPHHNRAVTDPSYQQHQQQPPQKQQVELAQAESRDKHGHRKLGNRVINLQQMPQNNPQKRMHGPPLQIAQLQNAGAKSQTAHAPLSETSSIFAHMQQLNHNHNNNNNNNNPLLDDDDDGLIFPGGTFGDVDATAQHTLEHAPHEQPSFASASRESSRTNRMGEGHKDAVVHSAINTPGPGTNMVMGQATGLLTFKLPAQWRSGGGGGGGGAPPHGLVPSKSMNDMASQSQSQSPSKPALRFHQSHGSHITHHKNASNGSTLTGGVSSPEIRSPSSVASSTMTPAWMVPVAPQTSLTEHGKNYSVDSQISQTSTTSTVSSIDANLELCCQILENVEHDSCALALNVGGAPEESLHLLEMQKQNVRRKILKLSRMLQTLEATFNASSTDSGHQLLDTGLRARGGGGPGALQPMDDDKSADDDQDFDLETKGTIILGQAASHAVHFNYPAAKN